MIDVFIVCIFVLVHCSVAHSAMKKTSGTMQEEETSLSLGIEKESEIDREELPNVVDVIAASSSPDVQQLSHEELPNVVSAIAASSSSDVQQLSYEDEISVQERTPGLPIAAYSRCDICSGVFSKQDMPSHKLTHGKPSWKCDNCSRVFTRHHYFIQHCRDCSLGSNENGLFECAECGGSFPTKVKFKAHARLHQERKYKCTLCVMTFRSPSCVASHMLTHTGAKPFTCEYCQKGFSRSTTLQRHMNAQTCSTKKPYWTCDICLRVFNRRGNLVIHRRFCSNQQKENGDFKCTECGEAFLTKGNLKTHSRCHREKQYKCTVCDKAFHTQALTNMHMNTHTGAKPFGCQLCPKFFSTRDNLSKHVRKHHSKQQ